MKNLLVKSQVLEQRNFEKWLQQRGSKIPSFGLLRQIREVLPHISIYNVSALMELNKGADFEGMSVFDLTLYLHNQFYPPLDENKIAAILSEFDLFVLEPNSCCFTFEALLSVLAARCGIDGAGIQKRECDVCLEELGWHDSVLPCGHVYHESCIIYFVGDACPECGNNKQ